MYKDSEILKIARNCKTIDEVMKACSILRELMREGDQPVNKYTTNIFLRRVKELA